MDLPARRVTGDLLPSSEEPSVPMTRPCYLKKMRYSERGIMQSPMHRRRNPIHRVGRSGKRMKYDAPGRMYETMVDPVAPTTDRMRPRSETRNAI